MNFYLDEKYKKAFTMVLSDTVAEIERGRYSKPESKKILNMINDLNNQNCLDDYLIDAIKEVKSLFLRN